MGLFAIGDLHLSKSVSKPMDIFGEAWINHTEKLEKNWYKTITENDTVLICGDTSWAINIDEAKPDLDFINSLSGKKVFIRGNHDYWWSSVSRLNSMYENMVFLQNDFIAYKNIAVCGSRGWIFPQGEEFSEKDLKTFKREEIRFRLSLESARKKGYEEILFMTHFPPATLKGEGGFMDILKEYNVTTVVYGHLHGKEGFETGVKGIKNGIDFKLVSADYIDFCPQRIFD